MYVLYVLIVAGLIFVRLRLRGEDSSLNCDQIRRQENRMLLGFTWTLMMVVNNFGRTASTITPSSGQHTCIIELDYT